MLVEVTPPVVASVEAPSGTPLSVNVTFPAGFAVPALTDTVAVKEIGSPVVAERDDTVTDVAVGLGATVSVRVDVEDRKAALPWYVATTAWVASSAYVSVQLICGGSVDESGRD
jgi:hypothetical protein